MSIITLHENCIENLEYLQIQINKKLNKQRNNKPFLLHLVFHETNKLLNGKLNYYTVNRTYYKYIVMLHDMFPEYFKGDYFNSEYNSSILNLDNKLTVEKLNEISQMFNDKILEMKHRIGVD